MKKLDRKFGPFSKWNPIRLVNLLARPKDQGTLLAESHREMARQQELMIRHQQESQQDQKITRSKKISSKK